VRPVGPSRVAAGGVALLGYVRLSSHLVLSPMRSVRMLMKRTLVIICTALVGLLLSSGVARADPPPLPGPQGAQKTDTAEVTGASATCTVPIDLAAISCSVKDTAADKHSVFVEWYDSANRKYRVNNTYGATREKTFVDDSLWKGVDTSELRWHVCVNIQWDNDRCSNYVNYAVGPNGVSLDVYCESSDSATLAATCTQLRNLPEDDGWQLSKECLAGAAWTLLGFDGVKNPEKGLLKKIPYAGWLLAVGDAALVVNGCS
jgi:hypothetical protein